MKSHASGHQGRFSSLGRGMAGAAIGLLAGATAAWADAPDSSPPDTSAWKCEFCPYGYGWSGDLDFGLMNVSQSNYKFGEYTGLYKSGIFGILDGNAAYRDKNGSFFDVNADNFGLGSRSLDADQGTQGLYELTFGYRETPQYLYGNGQTPFLGLGSAALTLPANWVTAGTTGQMTALGQDLQNVGIANFRRTSDLGIKFSPQSSDWHYQLTFQHDTQNGDELLGASILTNTSILPAQFDYSTDQVRASAAYYQRSWQINFGYYGSYFHDSNSSLTWSNPFTAPTPGATRGQFATYPGNGFSELFASGAWQVGNSLRLMGTADVGQGSQDDGYLPATINTDLATANLPRRNLDGQVDTFDYALRGYWYPLSGLAVTAEYTGDDHNDHTPQAAYQQAITDSYVADYVTNLPYSFSKREARVIADYHVSSWVKLEGGGEHDTEDRTFRDAASTETGRFWAELHAAPSDEVDGYLKATHERRFSPDYQAADVLFLPQNPLLRQFDLANRTRNQLTGQVSWNPGSQWGFGLSGDRSGDSYDDTTIGLTEGKDIDYTLDSTYRPSESIDLSAYYTNEEVEWLQSGSTDFSFPDWNGSRNDAVQTVGLSAKDKDLGPKLSGGLNFYYSLARGTTAVTNGTANPLFPDISMRMQGVEASLKYRLNERFGLRAGYRIERYRTSDWSLDGVAPNTIQNVLALGIYSPNYIVNVVSFAAEYTF